MTRSTRPILCFCAARWSFPEGSQAICLQALTIAAASGKAGIAKPLQGLGSGVLEIGWPYRGYAFE